MNRFIYRSGNDNAGFTVIENIFINEYIPEAKGDYVKVYLFGLKNSQNPELEPLSTGELARILDLTESDILKAFDYWESKKLVRIEEQGPDTNIIFMNINSMMHYPAAVRKQEPVQKTSDPRFKQLVDTVQNMLGGEPLTFSFMSALKNWVEVYGFEPETVILLVEHSLTNMERSENSFNRGSRLKYMEKVAENWKKTGIRTYRQAEDEIQGHRARSKFVYEFLREMRISGEAADSDYEMIDSWRNELGFSDQMILEGARRAGKKTMSYVNAILHSWHNQGFSTPEDLSRDRKAVRKQEQPQTAEDIQREEAINEFEQTAIDWFYSDNDDDEN